MRLIDELKSYNRFIVIGNGPLAQIDFPRYSAFVRFNNFEFSAEAGWHCTHWVTSGYFDVYDRPLPYSIIPWSVNAPPCIQSFVSRKPRVFAENDDHITRFFPDAFFRANGPLNSGPAPDSVSLLFFIITELRTMT